MRVVSIDCRCPSHARHGLNQTNMPDSISVSQLTRQIKASLNNRFPSVWVEGEISGITRPSSGHVYLTLKDTHAQINGIIWASDAESLDFELEQGMKVICRGGVDVYPQRGVYQIIIRRIMPQGIGGLQLAFKKLHAKLAAEGLFDPAHKRSLPRLPKHIAVVTSPTGAAVRDFLQILLRRWPGIRVTIVPCKVQGPGAADEIAAATRCCEDFKNPPDVIVVTRGGGSIEDLWAFNEEVVVRAIHATTIPVISGVGHEIDVTLSDLVADARALTPSEAAEQVVPDIADVWRYLEQSQQRLANAIGSIFRQAKNELNSLASRPVIRRPLESLGHAAMELDFLEKSIHRTAQQQIDRHQLELASLADRLNSINPLQVLARGYSLTSDSAGKLIGSCQSVDIGDTIQTQISDGVITSQVKTIQPKQ